MLPRRLGRSGGAVLRRGEAPARAAMRPALHGGYISSTLARCRRRQRSFREQWPAGEGASEAAQSSAPSATRPPKRCGKAVCLLVVGEGEVGRSSLSFLPVVGEGEVGRSSLSTPFFLFVERRSRAVLSFSASCWAARRRRRTSTPRQAACCLCSRAAAAPPSFRRRAVGKGNASAREGERPASGGIAFIFLGSKIG